jgi:hypothetical protein
MRRRREIALLTKELSTAARDRSGQKSASRVSAASSGCDVWGGRYEIGAMQHPLFYQSARAAGDCRSKRT